MTNGSMTLNGITDEQMASLFEAKAKHEGVLLFAPNYQPVNYAPPPYRPPYNVCLPVGPQNPRPTDMWPPQPGQYPGYNPPGTMQQYNGVIVSWNNDEGLQAARDLIAVLLQDDGQPPVPTPHP
jgi:hypothetical protein